MQKQNHYAELQIIFLSREEGGRAQPPWLNDQRYMPHLRVPPDEEMLGVEFVEGPEGPAPVGEPVYATVRFVYEPQISYASIQVGKEIEVVEGSQIVARGKVSRI